MIATMAVAALSSLVPCAVRADDKAACVEAYEKAQSLRDENQLVSAREQLRICARPSCTKFITKDCTAWLADIDSRIPSVALFARDSSGAEISNATVSIDGKVVAQQLDGHAVEVDAGQHTFTFTFADGTKKDQTYVVLEGAKAQRVGVTLPPAAPTPVPTNRAPSSQSVWGREAGATPARAWNGRKTLALVVGGVGVAGVGLGAAFGLAAISSFSSQKSNCSAPGNCAQYSQAVTDHQSAANASTISTVGFVGGGALIAAAAVLYFTAPSGSGTAESKTATGWTLVPSATPAGGAMWLRGTF
jgi:hypothetical protein